MADGLGRRDDRDACKAAERKPELGGWCNGALALLLDGAVGRVEKRLLKWQPQARQTEKL